MDEFKNQLSQKAKLLIWGFVFFVFSASLLLFTQFIGEWKTLKFIGQGVEFRDTVTVSGKGEMKVVPDTAEFSFAVIALAETASVAQEDVTKTMNRILEYLDDFGVEEKDVKTTSYNISPRYEYRKETATMGRPFPSASRRVLVGYEVSHWVTVKVPSIDDIGDVLAQVGTMGATNISSVRFTIDDEERVKTDARKKAIGDAKKKAKVLARDLGVSLVKIVSFSESERPIYYRDYVTEAVAVGGKISASPTPEIPVGENTLTSNVTIVYAIK